MPAWILFAVLSAESGKAIPPAPPVMTHSHYSGGRDVITTSVSVTCPKQGRYSLALHQKSGGDIIIDEIVSNDRPLPPAEVRPIQDLLHGDVLDFARIGCASWTQAIVDVAVNRRDGQEWRSVFVPIIMQDKKADVLVHNVRPRIP